MSRLAKLEIELFAGTAGWVRSMREAEMTVKVFGVRLRTGLNTEMRSLQGVFAGAARSALNLRTAIAGAALAFGAFRVGSSLTSAAEQIDKLGKTAQRLGISVEEMSALRFAAGKAGVEFERLSTMASRAARGAAELVARGNTTIELGRMTVRLTDAAGRVRRISELLPDLAQGIESVGSEAEQLRLSQMFFGRGGGDEFVTLLRESGTYISGIARETRRANQVGAIYTEDQFVKLRAYVDALYEVRQAWLGLKVRLTAEIAPALTAFLEDFATRLATLPSLIRATTRAFTLMTSGSREQQRAAAEMLARLRSSAMDLVRTTVIESGRLLGTALVESLRYGVRAIAPDISDVFRDAVGPILNQIPGVRIDPSASGKLADLRRQLADATGPDARARLGAAMSERARVASSLGRDVMTAPGSVIANVRLRQLDQEIARLAREDPARLRNAVAAQEAMVRDQDVDRMRALGDATSDYAASLADAGEMFRSRVVPGLQAFDAAADAVAETLREPEFVGPPPPPARVQAAIVDFSKLAAAAQDAGRKIGAGLSKGWETFKDGAAKAIKAADDLLAEAREYRFELYPQERVEADIARLRRVVAEARRLGDETALTEDEVEKIAASWRNTGQVTVDATRTVADDMRDAVEGFASDAGRAFADFAFDADASLDDVLKSWGKTLTSMAAQALVFKPLFDGLGLALFPKSSTTPAGAITPKSNAEGGPVSGGSWSWVGEQGPELVQFGRSGYVYPNGVMPGGGGTTVQVIDQRGSGARPEIAQSRSADGRKIVRILIRDEVRGMLADGTLDRSMSSAYGVSRRGASR